MKIFWRAVCRVLGHDIHFTYPDIEYAMEYRLFVCVRCGHVPM